VLFSRIQSVTMIIGIAALTGCQQARHSEPIRLDDLDKIAAASARKDAARPLLWYDAKQLVIEGKAWADTGTFFSRLPARAKGVVTDPVWVRGQFSTGLCVRFVTDSGSIHANWTVTSASLAMNHMPATSVSGVDLYIRHEGQWKWLSVGPPDKKSNEMELVHGLPAGPHEYMLDLPLYPPGDSRELGLDAQATLAKSAPRPADRSKPIVFYGTSITHGGCSSRPGMAYPAILGRRLDRATINLGFSGSGKMEPAMADLLTEIDAAVYVLDCLPNMDAEMVAERVEPFVRKLRAVRPDCPIILVENIVYQDAYLLEPPRTRYTRSNAALRKAYENLKKSGGRGLSCLPGEKLLGNDGEATVDGTHPTDVGFLRIADAMEPVLRVALKP